VVEVSGSGQGEEFRSALTAWEARLREVLDALAIGPLLGSSTYGGSVFVHKIGTDSAFFQHVVASQDVITVTEFQPELIGLIDDAIAKLDANDTCRRAALNYRESLLYSSVLVACVHLLRALEVLAGSKQAVPRCSNPKCGEFIACAACGTQPSWPRTRYDEIKRIIGGPAYDFFYRKDGVRAKLMHGTYVEQADLARWTPILRQGIQTELWTTLGLPGFAFGRERGPVRFSTASHWLGSSTAFPTLTELVELIESDALTFYSDPVVLTPDVVAVLEPY
jgi:hypothetical protein